MGIKNARLEHFVDFALDDVVARITAGLDIVVYLFAVLVDDHIGGCQGF